MTLNETSTTSVVVQGGVTATAIAFLHSALTSMLPYLIIAVPLVILDLIWGIRAARCRKEKVTFSRAFRKTVGKCFDYLCWAVLAATVALAFEARWLEWVIFGAVVFNELTSIVTNFFETKGIEVSVVNIWRAVVKKGSEKAGVGLSDDEVSEIIKPKPARDPETGRFIKKDESE